METLAHHGSVGRATHATDIVTAVVTMVAFMGTGIAAMPSSGLRHAAVQRHQHNSQPCSLILRSAAFGVMRHAQSHLTHTHAPMRQCHVIACLPRTCDG